MQGRAEEKEDKKEKFITERIRCIQEAERKARPKAEKYRPTGEIRCRRCERIGHISVGCRSQDINKNSSNYKPREAFDKNSCRGRKKRRIEYGEEIGSDSGHE